MDGRLEPGSQFAGYRIRSVLGEGGMGVVYLADRAGHGECALKVLTGAIAGDPSFAARFEREARYIASLEHPSIIKLYEAGRGEDGTAFIAMQFVRGLDLKGRITRGVLDAQPTVFILAQISAALDAAHRHGVIHRDVKPGNILTTDEGWPRSRAYLTDFGFARNPSQDSVSLTETGKFVGTTGYAAPEEVLAQPRDHRVDVYSLTCVMYECFVGEPPFTRATSVESLKAHLSEPRPSVSQYRPDLPVELDEVIARGMAISPSQRFGTCSELVEAAREALALDVAPQVAARASSSGPPAALKLLGTDGPAAGRELLLSGDMTFGRLTLFDGALALDDELSRRHARVYRGSDGTWMLEDLGSANGTYVNGGRIAAPHPLRPGDDIAVGASVMTVQGEVPATPTPKLDLRLTIDARTRMVEVQVEGGSRYRLRSDQGELTIENLRTGT